MSPHSEAGHLRLGPLALFFLLLLWHLLFLQPETYGDGILTLWFLGRGNLLSPHLLFMPALYLVTRPLLWIGLDTRTACFVFSALCSSGGSAVLFHLLSTSRRLAPGCHHPLLFSLLAASSPSLFFFGTQVENHAHHYFWVCSFLLVLDRTLGTSSWIRWGFCSFVLACMHASHSSSLLLLPALLLWIHSLQGERFFRFPHLRECCILILLLLPILSLRVFEPWILGTGYTREMAFRLLKLRDPATWIEHLWREVLQPHFGMWSALLVLLALRTLEVRRVVFLILAAIPYLLFFGHWDLFEKGAYYIPLLPILALTLTPTASLPSLANRFLLPILLVQAFSSTWNVWTFSERSPGTPEKWARHAADRVGKEGTVVCWDLLRGIILEMNHGVRNLSLMEVHSAILQLKPRDPDGARVYGERDLIPHLQGLLERGPLFITKEAAEFLAGEYPLWLEKIDANFDRRPCDSGLFLGFRILRR